MPLFDFGANIGLRNIKLCKYDIYQQDEITVVLVGRCLEKGSLKLHPKVSDMLNGFHGLRYI